jgi:hypothetical protein
VVTTTQYAVKIEIRTGKVISWIDLRSKTEETTREITGIEILNNKLLVSRFKSSEIEEV